MNTGENILLGWELNNLDPKLFDVKILEVVGECKDCEYLGQCSAPCESTRQLVPRRGELLGLGCEHSEGGDKVSCFAWVHESNIKFILVSEPRYGWAKASYVEGGQLPGWASAKFSQHSVYKAPEFFGR